ncbi:RNA-guided endonuclease TnpB family protein [Streptomyces sp. BI20]|uniref:RNA-guided endonuclease TnpB family protein n=1 Tax=Streptomyces sp. BI20 TaxID=3403460 RepID=UPI003C731846
MATTLTAGQEPGRARYTFRLRVSSSALAGLESEWARCRWVWNECVAVARRVHARNRATGERVTCGPAGLDRMLTGARRSMVRSRELPSAKTAAGKLARYQRMMARRATPRNRPDTAGYRKARRAAAKVSKKIARQRQDTARTWAKRVVRDFDRLAVEDFRPTFLAKTTMARKAADAAIGAARTALIEQARKHGRTVHLIHPAHTTTDCARCGARAKHALPLSRRTFTCVACGTASPRDKNSARVMLVRAGLDPAGADLDCVDPAGPATC